MQASADRISKGTGPRAAVAAALCAAALAQSSAGAALIARSRTVPVRVRLALTTASPAAELALDGGAFVNAAVIAGDGAVRLDGGRLSMVFGRGGFGELHVRAIVSGISPAGAARWRLRLASAAPARLEISNENDLDRPRLVDRFDTSAAETAFDSPASLLAIGGPLPIRPGPARLVLAFFYPWAQHWNWDSDRLQDRPLFRYSTDLPDEVAHSLRDAAASGLNGVVVSWRGDTNWNDRRLQIVLDQAPRLGLRVSILVETLLARTLLPDGSHGDFDPAVMLQWLEKAHDVFARQPGFLKVGNRPVVFVYAVDAFTPEQWIAIARSLEQGDRRMLLMADSLDPAFLEAFGGAFTYATARIPSADLARFDADQALRTKTYDLVHGGARRISAATVTPGYDDSLLGRDTTLVVGRANGALYEAQWEAAVAADPDWVVVTSWNEFWENTHIEPSERYGRWYQRLTRSWSEWFRR